MRMLPNHVIPIFFNQGIITGQIGAQVKAFDVYYRLPPAVGFHVIGCNEDTGIFGFSVRTEKPEDTILGFSATRKVEDYGVKGFSVLTESKPETETIKGFSVTRPVPSSDIKGFSVMTETESETIRCFNVTYTPKDYGVMGFIVEENE